MSDTTVYSSPQSVSLTKVDDASPIEDILEIPDSGKQFNRITSVSQLKDGGRYLLVCSTQANKIVPPVVVKKANSSGSERIGFDILNESVYVDDSVFGDYEKHLWTFTRSGNGWSIGDGEKFAAFTSTSNYKITATLEEDGEVFTVAGNDSFTFTSGKYCLNYNARGLINGYEGDPAGFCIFEYVGHSIKVKNGSAYVNGISVTAARGGETVTVKADAAPDGKRFDEWRLLEGDLEISNPRDEEISFVMPDGGVKLVAAYKDNVRGDANGDGRVTNADALAIYRYIFNPRIYPVDTEVSDLNADGIVTVLDILIIFRHIFDPTLPL